MNVKEAIARAKTYASDMFSGENMSDLGVEEVDKQGDHWRITLGLSRPWDKPRRTIIPTVQPEERASTRSYHVFTINDKDGKMINVRLRDR